MANNANRFTQRRKLRGAVSQPLTRTQFQRSRTPQVPSLISAPKRRHRSRYTGETTAKRRRTSSMVQDQGTSCNLDEFKAISSQLTNLTAADGSLQLAEAYAMERSVARPSARGGPFPDLVVPTSQAVRPHNEQVQNSGILGKLRQLCRSVFHMSNPEPVRSVVMTNSTSVPAIPTFVQPAPPKPKSILKPPSNRFREVKTASSSHCLPPTRHIDLCDLPTSSEESFEKETSLSMVPFMECNPSHMYDIINDNLRRLTTQRRSKKKSNEELWYPDHFYFVVDMDILLEHLAFIEELRKLNFCDTEGTILYVPYCVIQRLDKLKNFTNVFSLKDATLRAIHYINEKIENYDHTLQAQQVKENPADGGVHKSYEEGIVDCCLQLQNNVPHIMLLTEDTNLRNMGICNGLWVSSIGDLSRRRDV